MTSLPVPWVVGIKILGNLYLYGSVKVIKSGRLFLSVPREAITTFAVSMTEPPPIVMTPSYIEVPMKLIASWQLINVGFGVILLNMDSGLKTENKSKRLRLPFDVIITGFSIPSIF